MAEVVEVVDKVLLGTWGEDLAARHLEAAGYALLARNWRCREGELDIVAREGDTLVIVEVKTRTGLAFGEPASAVTPRKAAKLRVLAAIWLRQNHPRGYDDLRFDVVSVVRRPGSTPDVVHLEGAL